MFYSDIIVAQYKYNLLHVDNKFQEKSAILSISLLTTPTMQGRHMPDEKNDIEEQNDTEKQLNIKEINHADGQNAVDEQGGIKEHNEVNQALGRLIVAGKALNVVFILGIVLCSISLISPLLVWGANALGLTTYVLEFEFMWPTLLFNALQFGIFIAVFALCLSVSRYISKGRSPFIGKLARRMDIAGMLLLVLFVICLLWNPIFSLINPLNATWNLETGTYEDFSAPFINYSILIIAIIMFLLAHTLRYGYVLQALSDDTL